MVDFHNYITASLMIIHHIIPYGNVEFFAPPWTTPVLIPFAIIPPPYNSGLWQFGSIVAIVICAMLAIPKSRVYPLIVLIAPPTLFMLAVGQVSAFVALSCIGLLLETNGKRRLWVLLLCLFIASSKPHLVAGPALMSIITLTQKREYRKLFVIFAFFSALVISFELFTPGITSEWIRAMFSGSYSYGTPQQLQVTLSNGSIFQIGASYYHAPPLIVSLPLGIWFIYVWYKEGLTARIIASSLCICFLFLPYYRLYDLVMLYYPIGYTYTHMQSLRGTIIQESL
jgi:hypothetical protein